MGGAFFVLPEELSFDLHDDDISNIIAFSFIENLPPPNLNQEVRAKLGKKMSNHYDKMFCGAPPPKGGFAQTRSAT